MTEAETSPLLVSSEVVQAVQHGLLPEFLDYLQTHLNKSALPVIDVEGCSLLHWAAINNRLGFVRLLLERGADVNYTGGLLDESPLQWAMRNKHHCGVALELIRAGSDRNHRNTIGMDALQVAVRTGNVNGAYLLLAHHAKPDTPDKHGDTALLWLVKHLYAEYAVDLIRLLLRFGADLAVQDSQGSNCLMILCASKSPTPLSVLTLVGKYGNASLRRSASSVTGITPTQLAYSARSMRMIQFLIDLMLYERTPRLVIGLSNALAVLSLFVLLHLYGWVKGLALFVVVMFINTRLDMSTIEIGSSLKIHSKVYGLITALVYCYLVYLAQHSSRAVNVFLAIAISGIYITLYLASVTRASPPVSQDSQALFQALATASDSHPLRICPTCLVDRALATTHCSKCDMCVSDLDHHCPFVGTCVGPRNRIFFALFTLFAAIACGFGFFALYLPLQLAYCENKSFLSTQHCYLVRYPAVFASMWANLVVAMWVGYLFQFQLVLVAAETTTYDSLKSKDGAYIAARLNADPMKSLRHVCEFLLTGKHVVVQYLPGKEGGCCDHSGGGHSHDHDHADSIEKGKGGLEKGRSHAL